LAEPEESRMYKVHTELGLQSRSKATLGQVCRGFIENVGWKPKYMYLPKVTCKALLTSKFLYLYKVNYWKWILNFTSSAGLYTLALSA
jgi:hypothetical protein